MSKIVYLTHEEMLKQVGIFCNTCKKKVIPTGLHTHEVSCPHCGEYFGCDD